jgi:2-C-methyl-D-erythritol 4-phosphate cytidylyltransferase/2-C-methyl-D-erythritol 2,4-cyclodiphosphate synthase
MEVVNSEYVCIHDSARICINKKVFKRLYKEIQKPNINCVAPFINISDTVFYENTYLNRDNIKIIQTPQISDTKLLQKSLHSNSNFTDESSLMNKNGYTVSYVKGDNKLHKLTYAKDILKIACIKKKLKKTTEIQLIGYGVDTHKFIKNKDLFLGAVKIDSEFGLLAHSDGDVLIHSIIDALLGAINAGDIGEFFPDNIAKYKNNSSSIFLEYICRFINNVGFKILNIDTTIITEKPNINPHKDKIKKSLSSIIKIPKQYINIKATTSEDLGFIGRSEGISVHSLANVTYMNKNDFKRNKND